jgi:hypothetical protein
MTTPYTYLIGWTKHDVFYYGVRFAVDCHPNDLWVSYFTSSKKVKALRHDYGEPDIITVRKTFTEARSARLWEAKVIKRLNMPSSAKWLNMSDHNDKFYHEGPRGSFTDDHRRKLSEAAKKRKLTPEHKAKLQEGRRNSKNSPEHAAAVIASRIGSKHSEESKKKMSIAAKARCERAKVAA